MCKRVFAVNQVATETLKASCVETIVVTLRGSLAAPFKTFAELTVLILKESREDKAMELLGVIPKAARNLLRKPLLVLQQDPNQPSPRNMAMSMLATRKTLMLSRTN